MRQIQLRPSEPAVVTFAEQVEGLTSPYARFTPPAAEAVRQKRPKLMLFGK